MKRMFFIDVSCEKPLSPSKHRCPVECHWEKNDKLWRFLELKLSSYINGFAQLT